jgi:hypothetical protein
VTNCKKALKKTATFGGILMSISSKWIIICIFFIEDSINCTALENTKLSTNNTFDAFFNDNVAPENIFPVLCSIYRGISVSSENKVSVLKLSSVEVLKY